VSPALRACVAYVAGRLISGRETLSVYDGAQGRTIYLTGTVGPAGVRVFDFDRHCFFEGSGAQGRFQLFHHGERHYVSLNLEGTRFSGFDHGSTFFFRGAAQPAGIALWDQETNSFFNYSA
jgi:hypothetical protein